MKILRSVVLGIFCGISCVHAEGEENPDARIDFPLYHVASNSQNAENSQKLSFNVDITMTKEAFKVITKIINKVKTSNSATTNLLVNKEDAIKVLYKIFASQKASTLTEIIHILQQITYPDFFDLVLDAVAFRIVSKFFFKDRFRKKILDNVEQGIKETLEKKAKEILETQNKALVEFVELTGIPGSHNTLTKKISLFPLFGLLYGNNHASL